MGFANLVFSLCCMLLCLLLLVLLFVVTRRLLFGMLPIHVVETRVGAGPKDQGAGP
jgi:hypothetical protein